MITIQLFKKNDQWHRTYTELGDGKYDETMFVEISDLSPEYKEVGDYTLEELLDLAKRGFAYVGMHGLKQHEYIPSCMRRTCSTL